MCGISGVWQSNDRSASADLASVIGGMNAAQKHRGPDDEGCWVDVSTRVAFGHSRLSILDLSSSGHQPMASHGGRYRIVFNGEIYNHKALKDHLDSRFSNIPWVGSSDTEVLLTCIEHLGILTTLRSVSGMFAFALWDSEAERIYLARDRFGEKPLYFGWVGNDLMFASELKAISRVKGFSNDICTTALDKYLRQLCVPAPHTIYKDIFKLQPGVFIELGQTPSGEIKIISNNQYWSLNQIINDAKSSIIYDRSEAYENVRRALVTAVKSQMVADVPLGALLSGGIDSSLVVSLMQQQSIDRVNTFSVGFENRSFDESTHARRVAEILGTNHREITVTSNDAIGLVPMLATMYDEPFADCSQIPTHLICSYAAGEVTVALTGDGGDEVFGGYNRYLWLDRIWKLVKPLPYGMRQVFLRALRALPTDKWDIILSLVGPQPGEKLHKISRALQGARSAESFYNNLLDEWAGPDSPLTSDLTNAPSPRYTMIDDRRFEFNLSTVESMMLHDAVNYLPSDVLCKVDRAAMAASLETRTPFLDHNVVEAAWRLPLSMKLGGSRGKLILRNMLTEFIPPEIIERPKAGFSVPIGEWLRGPLRQWAGDHISQIVNDPTSNLNKAAVQRIWSDHQKGKNASVNRLWAILMLQNWKNEN